ncbi:MAG: hypothetical protein AAB413_00970 [Patescibacteria group bacterium]
MNYLKWYAITISTLACGCFFALLPFGLVWLYHLNIHGVEWWLGMITGAIFTIIPTMMSPFFIAYALETSTPNHHDMGESVGILFHVTLHSLLGNIAAVCYLAGLGLTG